MTTPTATEPIFWTTAQAAQALSVNVRTLQRWKELGAAHGGIPTSCYAYPAGGRIRYLVTALRRWAERRTAG